MIGKIISSLIAPFYLWKISKFEIVKVNTLFAINSS